MMRHFSFYDPATGALTGRTFGTNDADAIALNVPGAKVTEGAVDLAEAQAIEGLHNHRTHRVDLSTKQVVPIDASFKVRDA